MSGAIIRIYESELHVVVHETSLHPEIETGGSLFGLWTAGGNPTIVLATRPGPKAVRQRSQFEQDLELHKGLERLLLDRHGAQGLGLWHSHHGLGLTELSQGDLGRTMSFARRNKRQRFCDLLCYFGKPGGKRGHEVTVKPYVYADAPNGVHVPTELVVLEGVSPVREALAVMLAAEPLKLAITRASADEVPQWRLAGSSERLPDTASDATPAPTLTERALARLRSKSDEPQTMAIPDLNLYIHRYVEPAVSPLPGGARCEMEPTQDGHGLRLELTARGQTVELDLGWDGRIPVALSVRTMRREFLDQPQELSVAVRHAWEILQAGRI